MTGREGESVNYEVIDIASWPRREYFEHYLNTVPCTYSMTVKLDITRIRKKNLRLYPTMLYCITKVVNRRLLAVLLLCNSERHGQRGGSH